MKRTLRTAFAIWSTLTLLVSVSLAAIYLRNGMDGIHLFIQHWPLSNPAITLAATAWTWILVGLLLHLLDSRKIHAQNALYAAGFFLVMFVYLNVLRERFRYGDYHYYLEAATAFAKNQTLPDTYLYLPLWGAMLQYIVVLGDQGFLVVLWTVNIIALGGFYLLLVRLLERYGFTHRLAVTVTVVFLLVNAPLQRTLGFVQVNLLVLDFIFLSVLLYPKYSFASALALAFAVHLKTSPAVLVLAFLLEFNWRWLLWFGVGFLLIALFPVLTDGFSPYFDYLNNIRILTEIPDTNFHDTSFDSFLRFLNPFFGIKIEQTRILALAAKVLLLGAALWTMGRNLYASSFARDSRVLNALPSLFLVMTLGSPIVWDHHGLFTALSFLLMLKRVDSPEAWLWFGFAYLFEFVLPSFDFFPWSYGRLAAPLIVLGLMWVTSKNNTSKGFHQLNQNFHNLSF